MSVAHLNLSSAIFVLFNRKFWGEVLIGMCKKGWIHLKGYFWQEETLLRPFPEKVKAVIKEKIRV